MTPPAEFLTPSEAAKRLGVSAKALRGNRGQTTFKLNRGLSPFPRHQVNSTCSASHKPADHSFTRSRPSTQ